MGAFSTPLSGLTSAQEQLQAVSNNLANIDTDGYKTQNLTFGDIFLQTGIMSGNGDPVQIGSGVAVSSTDSDFTEGNLNATNTASNMAVSGNGFFITQSANGDQDFTRAGDFTTSNSGQLVTPTGELVLGYPAVNGVVNPSAALQPLQVSNVTSPAQASTTVGITANLDSDTVAISGGAVTPTVSSSATQDTWTYSFASNGTVAAGTNLSFTPAGGDTFTAPTVTAGESLTTYAADLNSALTTAGIGGADGITASTSGNELTLVGPTGFTSAAGAIEQDSVGTAPSSPVTIYDSLGSQHTLSVSYTKTAANTWDYTITMPSADMVAGSTGNTTVGSGTLNFNGNGQLASMSNVVPINIATLADGATVPLKLTGPFGTVASPTITQSAMASATSGTTTDGFASGTLTTFTVEPDGTINGTFTSGNTLALGQVAVASFANYQGLTSVGNNNYQATNASGAPAIGQAGTGGRGTIVGGSVEQSNVDIATEFAKLIVAQQAYSANAKSITTFSTLSQATLAMIQ
ncbi:MAG: flagellar hook-basal body complex protein [Terracidiphilus sp.]|jgi:flagellar hook protein FlgE